MKDIWKKVAIGAGIVLFFLGLSYGFMPQLFEGKIVNQVDITGYRGMAQEANSWNWAHPHDRTQWSDSMFGGMPTTAIDGQREGDWTQFIYDKLLMGKRPAAYLFVALVGGFLLMLAFGVHWLLAVIGAVAIAFCSYNFQIIQVGHNTKMQAIAFMPWVLAALVFTYRSITGKTLGKNWLPRVLLGASLFGLALSMQIKANHQQISYYLAILVLFYAVVEFIYLCMRQKDRIGKFFIVSALLLVLGGFGIATNVNKLLPLAKYTRYTMRGGSELKGAEGEAGSKGLDLAYATSWSYGWEELPNLMIPNFNGGSSAQAVDPDKSATIRLLKRAGQKNLRETAKNLPLYWGPQPFTAGPMYMGAITVFLFVLGLCLYRGREKWWLLAASLVAVLMAVGSHFMAFTALCFKVLPLYNKFRTVSMALVVLQVSLPLLGLLTLDEIIRQGVDFKRFRKALLIAFGITGGFSLLMWLAPGLAGDFSSASDAGMQDVLVEAFQQDRMALLKADAGLSFLLILASAGLLLWALLPKAPASRRWLATGGIGVLICLNLFVTGKRYLNADHFVTPKDFSKAFAERPVDRLILADQDPQYRVLDLTVNVFNSSIPSYRHKSIGGYSPAKLQRYQDLIDRYLGQEISALSRELGRADSLSQVTEFMRRSTPVLNMLNTRYVVLDGNAAPLVNPHANGAAWLVDRVVRADSPDDELARLGRIDPSQVAVIGADMDLPDLPGVDVLARAYDHIEMESYAPNALCYKYSTRGERLAVFSEIYYPEGWTATVDGEPLPLYRADWTLRAALLPAGEHRVEMRFAPQSYRVGAAISRATSIPLILISILSLGLLIWRRREEA